MASIASRIKEGMILRGLKQSDIVERTSIGKSSISTYLTGEYAPKQRNLYKIAEALAVDPAWLMGLDVPMEIPKAIHSESWRDAILPVKKRRIPLLGNIAAGEPMYAEEDLESYVLADEDIKCDFALRVCGDSMINARIHDGDIVFIRKQPDVSNGEIAAVLIDDTATLKRVHKIKGGLMLTSENPKYAPMYYTAENSDALRILGKAVAFQSEL